MRLLGEDSKVCRKAGEEGVYVCVWACVCVCSQRQTCKWVNRICSVSEADEVHWEDSSTISRSVTAGTWGVSGGAWSEGWGNQGGRKPCCINTANVADVHRHEGTWIHETVGFSRKNLLAYHCFTMLWVGFCCRAKWISYVDKCVDIYPSYLDFLPIEVIAEHWGALRVLNSRLWFVIHLS